MISLEELLSLGGKEEGEEKISQFFRDKGLKNFRVALSKTKSFKEGIERFDSRVMIDIKGELALEIYSLLSGRDNFPHLIDSMKGEVTISFHSCTEGYEEGTEKEEYLHFEWNSLVENICEYYILNRKGECIDHSNI
jgi:hypothetical protein